MVLPRLHLVHIRDRSLTRGVLLALGALLASLHLAGFPDINNLHSSKWQVLAVPFACWGMVETMRCMGKHWNLYHAGVLILLYTELMILATVVALWVIL